MSGLDSFQLSEPLVDAMVTLLAGNLNATIDSVNASYTDSYTVPHAVQFLPYVPIPSTLEGGMPAIGVQEIDATFPDDLQTVTDALHRYAVVATLQHSDHQTLTTQLRRMMQAIAYTISADRRAGTAQGQGGVMRDQGGAWSVNLVRTEPGPLLGDLDPTNPDAPPRTFLSWTALVMESMRRELNG